MTPRATALALVLTALLALSLPLRASGEQQKEYTCDDANGNIRSRGDLDEILAEHKLWEVSNGKSGTRANLRGANLHGANLSDVNQPKANLSGADLSGARLARANLSSADLHEANLSDANLSGALFEPAILPASEWIAEAKGLELITYKTNPGPLTQLRKQFQD